MANIRPPLPFLSRRLLSFSIKDTVKQEWEESGERNFSPAPFDGSCFSLSLAHLVSIAADFPYRTRLLLVAPHQSEMGKCFSRLAIE